MKQLSAAELADWMSDTARPAPLLLDVREPWEFERCHIDGACLIPMAQIPARLEEIDPDRPIVSICHHGMRSMQVAVFLERNGLTDVYNLAGGVEAWSTQVDPAFPRY